MTALLLGNSFIFRYFDTRDIVSTFTPGTNAGDYTETLAISIARRFDGDQKRIIDFLSSRWHLDNIKVGASLAYLLNLGILCEAGLDAATRTALMPLVSSSTLCSLLDSESRATPINHVDNLFLRHAIHTNDELLHSMVLKALQSYHLGGTPLARTNRTNLLAVVFRDLDSYTYIPITDDLREITKQADDTLHQILRTSEHYEHYEIDDGYYQRGTSQMQNMCKRFGTVSIESR